ncbi:MAG: glycoside hydrolase family 97 N-terminal domain-containing protein [Verrucomicrobiota bacterium]
MNQPNRLLLAAILCGGFLNQTSALEVKSPDGRAVLTFALKDLGGAKACPVYSVSFQGKTVLADSRLGLELESGPLTNGFTLLNETRTQQDTTWKPVCAERETIRDHYSQLVVDLQETQAPKRLLRLTFRAYDEGVAFAYTLPAQPGLKDFTIAVENTSFAFTGDHTAWAVYSAQGNYNAADVAPGKKPTPGLGEVPLSQVRPGVERPLTVRVADDLYAAITEARLVEYARMKLRPVTNQPHAMEAFLDAERGKYGKVTGTAPFTSPWRVVMLAKSPGQLLEQNYLILNLNDPCALTDTSWIKPGKVIREATLTTVGGKACVDFALQRGLQYIEYDAGWYGFEYDAKSDARDVHLDPKRNPDPTSLNLREVINYANAKGIGVILYVNHLALEKQLDEILPLYQQWGVKGVKYGFVNVGSQPWTSWLHLAIRRAAEHQLMVDIHDEFRNTGYQRTYPNLMTVEGILGNEAFPTPVHNATLPFTRFLTGPGDYTYCWYSGRLKPTHAHQLALSTIFFSPWQFLYWYDRPAMYKGEKELDYWQTLPTTWDETRVVCGEIGRCASVARRKGQEWYLGTIHPAGRKLVEIPLTFLAPGRKFTATTYSDQDPANPDSKAVKIETLTVDATTILKADLPANGGQAVRIVPQ